MKLFDVLYRTADMAAFWGSHWCGPTTLPHGGETLIAKFDGEGDGQHVEIYCSALPAKFYTIKVLPRPNSVGGPQDAYSFSTGSSCHELARAMAEAIAEGMLSLDGRRA